MGLDWFVQPKEEDGRRIEPSETAGMQYLDKGDADSVEKFRAIFEHNKAQYEDPGAPPEPEPKPGGLKGLFDGITGARRERNDRNELARRRWQAKKERHDYWSRPFETVLDETVGSGKRFVVQYAAPDRRDALARFLGTGDVYDFRPHELMEEYNAVGAFALNEEREVWPHMLAIDRDPDEMLELADEIEESLKAFRDEGRDKAGEDEDEDEDQDQDQEDIDFSIEIVEAAIPWLRFWAKHGHSIKADW